jgi:general stress protein 26
MEPSTSRQQQFSTLDDLIKDMRIAMLTTVDAEGSLRRRPMAAPQVAFDGALWFVSGADTPKVEDAPPHHQVNVSFADPEHQRYVAISGTASLVRERQPMEARWKPWFRTWFPQGLDAPHLTLLKVDVAKAEYWDTPSRPMVPLSGVVQATLTGKAPQAGEHAKLSVDERQTGASPRFGRTCTIRSSWGWHCPIGAGQTAGQRGKRGEICTIITLEREALTGLSR